MKQEEKLILYTTDGSNVTVSVRFEDEDFWMTQKAIGELFGVGVAAVSKHIKNIFEDEELSPDATVSKMEIVQDEGARTVKRLVDFFNLDMVIAVGYRVTSKKATRFRQWATKTLHEYTQKGFVLNDDLLQNGKPFGRDYFDELLERIREIRASERRAYQKIADVFEQCSYDYDKDSNLTREFYAFVLNKLHYAITGRSAAELFAQRASLEHSSMGLTTWEATPQGKILKSDVVIAKNYLNEQELSRLNWIVDRFIDHAELMAEDQVLMSMADWLRETEKFLEYSPTSLPRQGSISHKNVTK